MNNRSIAALLASLLVLIPAVGFAQSAGGAGFDAEHFNPGASQHTSLLNLERPDVLGHLVPSAGVFVHYADDPVQIVDPDVTEVRSRLVDGRLRADAGFALGLFDRLELDVTLPFVLYQDGAELSTIGGSGTVGGFALADTRASLRAQLVRPGSAGGFGVALSGTMYAPTGDRGTFNSDGGFRGVPRATFGWQSRGGFELLGNLGFELGPSVGLRNYAGGRSLQWGAGGAIPIVENFDFIASVFGEYAVVGADEDAPGGGDNAEAHPIEALGALRFDIPGGFRLQAGGGTGLNQGVGAPDFRTFLSFHWANRKRDTDGDGLLDRDDDCPKDPEDEDGFEDEDGCPDTDNDDDGLRDDEDSCPDEPEDEDGFEDDDGCPDRDNDGDGKPDADDECPDEPEDEDGFEDEDGCPDPDNDDDGIEDEEDECPDTPGVEANEGCPENDQDNDGIKDRNDDCPKDPEDKDGFEDDDGCPDTDNDQDGIVDDKDQCPDDPETYNGHEDADGCPDEAESKAKVVKQKIEISEKVHFAYNEAEIEQKSYDLLRDVADLLKKYPQITEIRIEGHTDSKGGESYNEKLSHRRAASVRQFLVGEGVGEGRLTIVGKGESEPIADNDTKAGRAKNRRVEFVITEVDGEEVEGGGAVIKKKRNQGEGEQ